MALCLWASGCMDGEAPHLFVAPDAPEAAGGKKLYDAQGCVACHAIGGSGGKIGPDLSNEGNKGHSETWLITQLRAPKTYKSDTLMPAYPSLTDKEVKELVGYLLALSSEKKPATGPATAPATSAVAAEHPGVTKARNIKAGAQIWSDNCGRCHNSRAPSSYTDDQWAVAVHHMRLRVPLTGEQERLILEFLQSSN
jgi:mono/diheme cytochrome c family protein